MQLKAYARHLQLFDLSGSPVIYTGPNPASLAVSPGSVPQTTWLDITNDVANRDSLELTWTLNVDDDGNEGGSFQIQKSTSGDLRIEADAYRFIKAWLIEHVAAPLNAVEVKIEDTSCGFYEGYVIRSSQITWCENEVCEFDVTLTQRDDALACIRKTLIEDNWQGWFQTEPAGGKRHPRFSYCNEIRPNGQMILLWWFLGSLMTSLISLLIPLFIWLIAVVAIINAIIAILNAISSITGTSGGSSIAPLAFPSIGDFFDMFTNMYVNSAGCGREHPAPLIRDYITNVCDKCGITVDAVTAPIFFAPNIDIETSTGLKSGVVNPHYNACYLNPEVARGIKRFRSFNVFSGGVENNTDYWIADNSPLLALDQLLDKLKDVYNAHWRIAGNKLYFWRKDWYSVNSNYLYDFSTGAADRAKILEGVCFEWNEVKFPAYVKGLYEEDAADTCGNEVLGQMNGYASFGNVDNNPLFDGVLDKTTQHFGGTRFRFDGSATDYISDAMQVICNMSILNPLSVVHMKAVDGWMNDYAQYALLMKDETCTLPKIIIWDGESYTGARAIRNVVPVNNYLVPSDPQPAINPKYNLTGEGWAQRHAPKTSVLGAALTFGSAPTGVYKVTDVFGGTVANNAARLANYPMYFEPYYEGTLWDWFHWIDDPRRNPALNMRWNVKIDLCCPDLQKLGVLGDASNIALGQKIKLPTQFYHDGIIKEITVSYDGSTDVGKHIEISGTV